MYKIIFLLIIYFAAQYFIYKKLSEADVSKLTIRRFIKWGIFCALIFFVSVVQKFYFYNLVPNRYDSYCEIISLMSGIWIIITILGFFSFLAVDIFTLFKGFTKKKVIYSLILTLLFFLLLSLYSGN